MMIKELLCYIPEHTKIRIIQDSKCLYAGEYHFESNLHLKYYNDKVGMINVNAEGYLCITLI